MKSKFNDIVNGLLKESSGDSHSIGNALYNLYVNLDPKAKTKSGALVSEVLKDILNEMNDVVNSAKQNLDQPETIHSLLQKLSLD